MSEPKVAGETPMVLQLEEGAYYWCACGRSQNQPWCDGAHAGSGIEPVAFTVEEPSTKALCLCKQTAGPPFCDGSHSKL